MSAVKRKNQPKAELPKADKLSLLSLLPLVAACVIAPLLTGIPDEAAWTSLVCAFALTAWAATTLRPASSSDSSAPARLTAWAAAGLIGVAVAGLCLRWLVVDHGSLQYIDVMMRGLIYWTALIALLRSCWIIAQARFAAYVIAVALVAVAGIAAAIGLQDYLINALSNHIPNWREFGTSYSPDYFAAYLLITIPVTLALYLGAPAEPGKRISWLFALAFLLQVAVLPTTGSRFALISFVVSLIVFAIGLIFALKNHLVFTRPMRVRLMTLAGLAVIGAALFAGPVVHRLQAATMAQQSNSGSFRIWTWRGSLRLAEHHPLFGVGPDMFVYEYPKFALVGFTRIAHSGFLQVLDDFGAFGLAALLLVFVGCLWAGAVALTKSPPEIDQSQGDFLRNVTIADDRLLAIGLISGVVAALLQNTIDSDWNIPLCGVTLFLAAGLLMAISTSSSSPTTAPSGSSYRWLRISAAAVALLMAIICLPWSAAGFAAQSGDLEKAAVFAPLNGDYKKDLAWKIEIPAGDWQLGEDHLNQAIALTPDPVAFYRRSILYEQTGRPQLALNDIRTGLTYDPNSIELMLQGARVEQALNDPADALSFYRKMASLQDSRYGTILAITDVTEYRYAYADYALGITDPSASGIAYLKKAQQILQDYADEGDRRRQMMTTVIRQASSIIDSQLQNLYVNDMRELSAAYRRQGDLVDAAAADASAQQYIPRFVQKPH